MGVVINNKSGSGIAATLTGNFAVDGTITAALPAGVVGTLQFTRTLLTTPFTKSNIASAVANAVNSLTYQIQQGDIGYSIGVDASNQVAQTAGGGVSATATVPGQPAKPILTAMTGAVSISWTPGAAGSSPTTGNVWLDINGVTTPLTTNPQVIAVPSGTPYTGTVKTQNAQGFGPASAQADAATSKYPIDSRGAWIGDSISQSNAVPSHIQGGITATGGRIYLPIGFNQALAGTTLQHMRDTQLPAALALKPVFLFMAPAGTNNLPTTSDTPQDMIDIVTTIYNTAIAAGVGWMIVGTIMPRTDATFAAMTTARKNDRVLYNNLLKALNLPRLIVVDLEGFDPATMSIEGLHPNWLGEEFIAPQIYAPVNAMIEQVDMLAMYNTAVNKVRNAALTGTAGAKTGTTAPTGVVADNCSVGVTLSGVNADCSKVVLSSGLEAQRIVVSGTATAGQEVQFVLNIDVSGVVGDAYDVIAKWDLATGSANVRSASLSINNVAITPNRNVTEAFGATGHSGLLRSPGYKLTTTATTLQVTLGLKLAAGNVAADMQWMMPLSRKLTGANAAQP